MTAGWLERLSENYRRLLGAAGVPARSKASAGPRTAVVTDSAAALPPDCLADPRLSGLLRVVAMPVMIGQQIYTEGVDDLAEALIMALAEGKSVQTSRPAPGQFLRTYRELAAAGFDAIVSVHVSGALSGTADAARLAAREVDIPVEVVDSRSVAMGQGFAVLAAALAASAGGTPAAVAAAAADTAAAGHVLFYVPSLEQLRRGGRISMAAGLFGTLLSVKPILGLSDGAIVPVEKVRSAPKAVARLEELVRERALTSGPDCQLAIHYFGAETQAREIGARLEEATGQQVLISVLPAVLAAHAGVGIIAAVISGIPAAKTPAAGTAAPETPVEKTGEDTAVDTAAGSTAADDGQADGSDFSST